jgi:8-oxo-dGTP pyrophosphatase MutT (NUDIX family)
MLKLETFLRDRLRDALPGHEALRRFAPSPWLPNWSPDLLPDTARRAAALILLFPGPDGPLVPLTVRHRGLPQHAGQVSLPGGAIDLGESPEAAALREAEEEIGVRADRVRLVGALSTLWVAVSNFVIHPCVGVAHERPEFLLHPEEVEALLEVPLDHLRDPSRLRWMTRERQGHPVRYPYYDVGGHVVWGATAMILGEFACLFDEGHRPPALD